MVGLDHQRLSWDHRIYALCNRLVILELNSCDMVFETSNAISFDLVTGPTSTQFIVALWMIFEIQLPPACSFGHGDVGDCSRRAS